MKARKCRNPTKKQQCSKRKSLKKTSENEKMSLFLKMPKHCGQIAILLKLLYRLDTVTIK